MDNKLITRMADNIRVLAASMVEKAQSGHPGGAMGGADFVALLYAEFIQYDPHDMRWINRDRFFLDPGHMSAMLYAVLALHGHYSMEDCVGFRQWGSHTPGHPEVDVMRGVENTSGPLGQGHAMALGAAIAERFLAARFGDWMSHKTYTYISDGGVQEEISQAVGRLAGHLGLSNLIMFYDSNDIQLSTTTCDVTSEDTAAKYKALGWVVETVDGHNIDQMRDALKRAQIERDRPTLIIGRTVMGKCAQTETGASFERQVSTHGQPLSKAGASIAKTITGMGGDPANPFKIWDDVAAACNNVRDEKSRQASEKKRIQQDWAQQNPALAAKLAEFFSGTVPAIDYAAITQKAGIATRAAGGAVLAVYAEKVDNMIVASADLSNSDNTDSFLKKTKALQKGDFTGKFLQIGVSELTMATIMNGIALHGGIWCACGTFMVFCDYMKPAIRLSALMGLPVKYILTHDSFRVGEDGPTHQPIEHEAQLRLLEKMNNLEGKRSMLVVRPADATEATVAWKLAMENTHAPTALLLSRQNIADLPVKSGSTRYADALQAARGAYVVGDVAPKPAVVLLANGSEVAILVEAAKLVQAKKNVPIQIVSVISEGLFNEQPLTYRLSVLPEGVPIVALTAGLPCNFAELVAGRGTIIGMSRFGASASFKVLDEKFGYTPAAVADKILSVLS